MTLDAYPHRLFHAAAPADAAAAARPLDGIVSPAAVEHAWREISNWEGYRETPLLSLPGLARAAGVAAVACKYEADRFGLGSFKALGGAYAVMCALQDRLKAEHGIEASGADLASGRYAALTSEITVATASDGNHGLSVAWGAKRFGCRSIVFLHKTVSQGREDLIRDAGGATARIDGNYDDSTHAAEEQSRAKGWILVADTTVDPADFRPATVMAGYGVMAREIRDQYAGQPGPTHVFLQGGCGGMAAAIGGLLAEYFAAAAPRFVVVEPENADCLFRSAAAGTMVRVEGDLETIMAGLSVGEVSALAWPVMRRLPVDYLTIPDSAAQDAMARLARGGWGDGALVVGDAGVAGIAGLLTVAADPGTRDLVGLDSASRVLTIVTEGAVDRIGYRALTGLDPDQVASVQMAVVA